MYLNNHQESTIQFHRLYRENWFHLGHYFLKLKTANKFISLFMLQGQFLLIEETNKCLTPRPIYCFDTRKQSCKFAELSELS